VRPRMAYVPRTPRGPAPAACGSRKRARARQDIECIDSLADAIKRFKGGLVLVSHDFRLIDQARRPPPAAPPGPPGAAGALRGARARAPRPGARRPGPLCTAAERGVACRRARGRSATCGLRPVVAASGCRGPAAAERLGWARVLRAGAHARQVAEEIWVCDKKTITTWKGDIRAYKQKLAKGVAL